MRPGRHMGVPRPRSEDQALTRGSATFVDDVRGGDDCHAVFVRSAEAHGWLTGLSVAAARAAPGVVAAFTAANLDLGDIPDATGAPGGPPAPHMRRPPLVRDRVRYSGEPLAVVVATDRYLAADAAELVAHEIEPLPPVVGFDAALRDDVLLFPSGGTNVVARRTIPTDTEMDELPPCPVAVRLTLRNQRLAPTPVEPLAVRAEPDGDGVTVWCPTQTPHRLRDELADVLRLDPHRIHVVSPQVGGGFGLKAMFFPEVPVVAAAALRLGRPVAWTETRSEQFLSGTHGRGQRHEIALGGDPDGRLRAVRLRILGDAGAYPHNGSKIPFSSLTMAPGCYDIPDFKAEAALVVTTTAPTGSYRGAGRPEATYTIERAVDAFARACGLPPEQVRRRNVVPPSRMPFETATGMRYDSGDYAAVLERALAHLGVEDLRAEQRKRLREGGPLLGVGVGLFVERAGGNKGAGEIAQLTLREDGGLEVAIGTSPTGQGHDTVWRQIVGEVFGLDDPARIHVLAGDTRTVARGTGTYGSRSVQVGGSALLLAARGLRARVRAEAADLLEVSADDLRWDGRAFHVAGDPAASADLAAVARHRRAAHGDTLAVVHDFSPDAHTFPYGAHGAVVEVDTDTGMVSLLRMVAVDDCGTIINPLIVEGQIHGSLLQGIAQALLEEVVYDAESGQLQTSALIDYLAPTAPDAPTYETDRLVTPAPSNPLGAKGAGEAGCIGAPPAIVNAALDALAPLGVEHLDMPLTPERVWGAIQAARSGTESE